MEKNGYGWKQPQNVCWYFVCVFTHMCFRVHVYSPCMFFKQRLAEHVLVVLHIWLASCQTVDVLLWFWKILQTIRDGIKNTKHHSVSLVKQFFTCCHTQQSFQRWNSASCQAYGLVKTQHPMKTSLEFPTRLFEHEQSQGFQHQKSTTSNWWTWSTDHQHSHTPLVDHTFQNHHWSTSQWGDQ